MGMEEEQSYIFVFTARQKGLSRTSLLTSSGKYMESGYTSTAQ